MAFGISSVAHVAQFGDFDGESPTFGAGERIFGDLRILFFRDTDIRTLRWDKNGMHDALFVKTRAK
jgi:hypothetical protein